MKSILIILGLFCFGSAFSQSDFDQRLLVKYDAEQIAQLQENDSRVLDYWTYYLDYSYEIVDIPSGKENNNFEEIKIKSMEKFNILDSKTKMDRTSPKYYRIKGTNEMLVLLSGDDFTKKFNAHHSK